MDQLINSLPALLQAAGDTAEIRETAVLVAWNHVAGDGLRQQTVPLGFRQQRLFVAVADAIWRRQLESMTSQLLFRLNALLGQRVLTYIEFQVDPRAIQSAIDRRRAAQNLRPKTESEMVIPFELVSAAAAIHDVKLRKAFLGAAMSCARRLQTADDLKSET